MEEPMALQTRSVNKADAPQGSVGGGKAGAYAYLPTSIAAIQATNDLLARGVAVSRVPASFADGGRTFDAGVFILPGSAKTIANELASQYGLDVFALKSTPAGAIPLRQQRIAAYISDAGGPFLLKRFGFAFDVITRNDLNDATKPPLTDYDVFINTSVSMTTSGLNATGKAKLTDYFAAGKDYIGIGGTGALLASQMSLFAFTATSYVPAPSIPPSGSTTTPATRWAADSGRKGTASPTARGPSAGWGQTSRSRHRSRW